MSLCNGVLVLMEIEPDLSLEEFQVLYGVNLSGVRVNTSEFPVYLRRCLEGKHVYRVKNLVMVLGEVILQQEK